ncbi:MAG: alkylation repair protein [Patescibacteria group bacterium]|nr:alkylation repair protein [Patescibacteria group bacterium]
MTTLDSLRTDLRAAVVPEKAKYLPTFFKSGPGQYAEGDQFIGVTVPAQRLIVKKYWQDFPLADIKTLLHNPIHEERLTALLIMVRQYQKDPARREALYDLYLANTARVNNWDLVDASAEHIVGPWLKDRDKSILARLAASNLIWDRRIAMLATFHYIKQGQFDWPLRIAGQLCRDPHDLIQKAVGWMLREIGKRDRPAEVAFLARHYRHLPRVTLRYAIEHFDPELRQQYLKGKIL